MKGKTVVITGGNDGIGYQTALELARREAGILMLSRNRMKAENAVQQIKAASGNNRVDYVLADLANMKSIRAAAAEITTRLSQIDVLINNAGGVFSAFERTDDGLERTIGINHFAGFLLTGLLMEQIKKAGSARIVNVSSDSHYQGTIDFASFKENRNYTIFTGYRQSKLANVLFTFKLASLLKNTDVTVNCLHPGTVKTRLANKTGRWLSWAWSLATLFAIDAAEGAKTSIYLASSPEAGNITGKYFYQCKVKEPNPLAYDEQLQEKLWKESEKITGVTYPLI